MKMKQMIKSAVITAICAAMISTAYAAPTYQDVPTDHWGYTAITNIADKGIIVGDTQGNYKPNDRIDKFETSKILAKVAGFKYTNISQEEQVYYDRAYEKNKNFLSQFHSAFAKWNSTADREIAFLLEKEILTVDDLNQFIIKDSSNVEQLRALSREECAVFLVKVMGSKDEALIGNYAAVFADDDLIALTKKPYVYYLLDTGIITDGGAEKLFNPKLAVTRAAMAVMLNNMFEFNEMVNYYTEYPDYTEDEDYDYYEEYVPPTQSTTQTTTQTAPDTTVSNIETISGTIDKLYPALNAIQVLSQEGNKNIYKISSSATIYIDSYLKTVNDLKEQMMVIGVLNNGDLVDIKAHSASTNTVTVPVTNVQLSTLQGTISSAEVSSASNTIGLEVRMLNPKGEILTEVRSYALSSDCKITRGDSSIGFNEIKTGEIATIEVSGSTVYTIRLEQKNTYLTDAKLTEKKYVSVSDSCIFVVTDKEGKTREFRIAADTYISRKGQGQVSWDQIRIGDTLDITAEYDSVKELYAYGVTSSLDGWVQEIHISKNRSYITLLDLDKLTKTFDIIPGSVDVYSLRIGSKVRLRLDSQEIETYVLLEEAAADYVTGTISKVRSESILISGSSMSYGTLREVMVDDSTVIIDSITGNKVSFGKLDEDMGVYIIFSTSVSNLAKTITILSK